MRLHTPSDKKHAAQALLEMMEKAKQGGRIRADEAFWAQLRREVAERLAERRMKKA